VRSAQTDGRVARLEVSGSIDPLLKALETSEVTQLLSREPSLEELFLSLYGEAAPSEATSDVR